MRSAHTPIPTPPAAESATTLVIPRSGFVPSPVAKHLNPGWPRIRGYEILSVIGSGGMAIVYKALHRDLRRTVAIKMLRGADLADAEYRERFQAEAEAVARLQHPNIIQVFEIGVVESQAGEQQPGPFIALEFVEGGCLNRLTGRPQPPRHAAEMVERLACAVHSAHRLGVVHRDLKPANVLLTREGEPKIADFGLAKQLGSERDAGGRFLTNAGTAVGTPEYMAPEQARGDAPTPAIDIYALGVILYELLTARMPFHGETPIETMDLLQRQEPVSPSQFQPGLPRDLETICLKCLEKDPARRYATADDLAHDLRNFLDNRAIRARRLTRVEKLARWCRHNPLVAISLAGVVGVFLTAFVLVSRSYWRAEAAWREEALQRQEAQRKEQAERWERYRADIVATASALQVYNVSTAQRTLEDAPAQYRNWEWRHYRSRLDLAQRVLRPDLVRGGVTAVARDGSRAVLINVDGYSRAWDTTDGHAAENFRKVTCPHLFPVLSPDGKLLAYAADDNSIVVRDIDTDHVRTVLRGHGDRAHTIHFSADSTRLFTASNDLTMRVWDLATGCALRVLRPFKSALAGGRFSPDGRRVVATDKTTVCLFDGETGDNIATLHGHEERLQGIWYDRCGDRFVTNEGYPSHRLRLWNAATGKLIRELGRHKNTVTQVEFNADGTRIASSSMDQMLGLWDGLTGEPIATLKGHNGRVNCLAFSPDGTQLVSASEDRTARLWDAVAGAPVAVLNGDTDSITSISFSADGSRIVSVSLNSVRFWDVKSVANNGILKGHTSYAYHAAFHPDGKRVASVGWDGTLRIWDATTGEQKLVLDHGADRIISSVAIHPDGRTVATRARGAVYLWDLETGRLLHRWSTSSDTWRDTRLAFSPNGELLASGRPDGDVCLWDVNSRKEAALLRGHRDLVGDVAFSPNGRWLASAGSINDKTVRIWDVAKKEQVRILDRHMDWVYALAFSADGSLLASGSVDGAVRLWDTEKWEEVGVLKHSAKVYGLAFSPDGTRIACSCADTAIHFWDVAKRQPVAELRGHGDYVHAIAFSPDGTRLASASGDMNIRIWDTVRPQDRQRLR